MKILFISNGHGEDNQSHCIIEALGQVCSSVEIAAIPIVGEGNAYRRLNIPIISPTQTMPSGGFFYMNPLNFFQDLQSGLVGLTWRQLQAVWQYAPQCDLIMATGDLVPTIFAYLTGRPFVSFISPLSSYYEGRLNLGLILWQCLNSPQCKVVITKDPYTAKDLKAQGLTKVVFGGLPALDKLIFTGKDLNLLPDLPVISLLPGSRLPEAIENFQTQLRLVLEIAKIAPSVKLQFRAALVPNLIKQLTEIGNHEGWQVQDNRLVYSVDEKVIVEIGCYADAFNDILYHSTLVIGMAGSAVEQAVALGKPVIQIPGKGPQFTYRFAEAQMRLLGSCVQTIGTKPATTETLQQAAKRVIEILADQEYLAECQKNGRDRFGATGASVRIANILLTHLKSAYCYI